MQFLLLLLTMPTLVEEPKSANDWTRRGLEQLSQKKFAEAIASFDQALKLDKDNVEALDARGSAQFFRSKFAESVADFDRVISLRPDRANGHWRRGISLYYAGKYEEGIKQFQNYEKVDTNDVENAVWHFLCAARKDGQEKARASLLQIGRDRRVPMMEVYHLFQGKLKPEQVLASAQSPKLTKTEQSRALFYAHLYLGLYHDLNGDQKRALQHLTQAAGKYKVDHYMGEVARVHAELLQAKK